MSSSSVKLHLRTPVAPLEMRVTDHNHRLVTTGFGEISRRVSPGLYALQIFAGPTVERRFLSVGPEGYEDLEIQVEIPSAAPVGGTSTMHEFHGYPAKELSQNPMTGFGHGGRIVIFLRNMGENPQDPVNPDGLEFVGPNLQPLANAFEDFKHEPDSGWSGFSAEVEPGGYLLRMTRPRRRSTGGQMETIDQSIWVEEGWVTLIFIPFRAKQGFAEPENASIHMARMEVGFDPYTDDFSVAANIALEVALSGLRQGRAAIPHDLEELMLQGKFGNPMLGLVGALSLIQSPRPNWRLLDIVRKNLRQLVPNHPDLLGIQMMQKQARDDTSESRVPEIFWPPMLFACYRGVIDRDAEERNHLIAADSMADLAAARLYPQGPWTRWQALQQPEQSDREAVWEKRLQRALEGAHRVTETAALDNKAVQELKESWEKVVEPARKPRHKRPEPSVSAAFSMNMLDGLATGFDPSIEIRETTLVANQIQELTEQIARKQVIASEDMFDVRVLSSQTGLPRVTVERALKNIAGRGFKF